MDTIFYTTIRTPIGYLKLESDMNCLLSVSFTEIQNKSSCYQPEILENAVIQLKDYFSGKRQMFNLRLNPTGTEFQQKVWALVMMIPFGETASYLDIALQIGSKNNTRAIGLANAKNPIPIIIPCHRVIGVNKKLTGYAGGIDKKRWLLEHELNFSNPVFRLF